ncbi:hypothetical protein DL762_006057 [Monosporascus cannonballus]|uniref:Uncharacterized protein n=1 Tax=Monosporascus cannonballus TaxID=155416 RepID=A0ABY0H359_9PEZI|nr:hypothetical protein DL762_006057 [Monosporascus cannonballus]
MARGTKRKAAPTDDFPAAEESKKPKRAPETKAKISDRLTKARAVLVEKLADLQIEKEHLEAAKFKNVKPTEPRKA